MSGSYKNKPVIGITPGFDEAIKLPQSEKTLYLRRTYTAILESVGAIPVILNPEMPLDYVMQLCDGIVISGGEDLQPEYYNGPDNLYINEPKEHYLSCVKNNINLCWEFVTVCSCWPFITGVLCTKT